MPAADAAIEAARLRLRPILMTSFAFIFGVLPLIFATGAGAEMRQALGTVVFFGMLGVTFFGVFLTPVFFTEIRKLTRRDMLRDHEAPPRAVPPDHRLPAPAADHAPDGGNGR
jgi:Cu/Ag efflux pump CusA